MFLARVTGSEHLTNAGFMMGTPAYMAPEQVQGGEVDARADLYAMGVVFYRLATAALPFKGETPFAMAQSQLSTPPTPVATLRSDLPDWVEQIITRALGPEPQVEVDEVRTVGPVALVTGARGAVLGPPVRVVVVVEERRRLRVDGEDHRAPATAVAAVRPAERLELLAAHRRHPVAAAAGGDVEDDAVDEGRHAVLLAGAGDAGRGGPCPARPSDVVRGGRNAPAATSLGGGGRRDDVDDLAAALGAELDGTGDEREERVVTAAADAVTGVEVRTALADEDLAGLEGGDRIVGADRASVGDLQVDRAGKQHPVRIATNRRRAAAATIKTPEPILGRESSTLHRKLAAFAALG